MKTIRTLKMADTAEDYYDYMLTYLANDAYPQAVSPALRRALFAEGYTEVVINIDGQFYAIGDKKRDTPLWAKTVGSGRANIVVTDIDRYRKWRPLDAVLDTFGVNIPQIMLCSVLDLHTGEMKLRSASDGKVVYRREYAPELDVELQKFTQYVNVERGLSGKSLAEAVFKPFINTDLGNELLKQGFTRVMICDKTSEYVATNEDGLAVDDKGYVTHTEKNGSNNVKELNIFEWADGYDNSAPHSGMFLSLETMDVTAIGRYGVALAVYHTSETVKQEKATEPATAEAPTEEVNPKDVIGSSKIPMTLWPATATAYGAVGLFNGALKYGKANFRATPVKTSIYVDACMRHLASYMEGEEVDPDDGVPHLAAALASIAIIVDAKTTGTLIDDRQIESAGFRETMNELTGHVKRLQELHADKSPKHHIRSNDDDAS